MAAILSLLKAHKLLAALGAVILALSTAFGVQTWRIGQLQQEIGSVSAQLDQAVAANESNQVTVTALVAAARRNAARYAEAIERAEAASTRIGVLTTQIREQADDDIAEVERAGADVDCAHERLPADIRVRLNSGGNRDAGSPGNSGTADPARP